MPYVPFTWKDRTVQYPRRYTKTDIDSDTVELVPEPGTITEAGTALTSLRMNAIEQGINQATLDIETALYIRLLGGY